MYHSVRVGISTGRICYEPVGACMDTSETTEINTERSEPEPFRNAFCKTTRVFGIKILMKLEWIPLLAQKSSCMIAEEYLRIRSEGRDET